MLRPLLCCLLLCLVAAADPFCQGALELTAFPEVNWQYSPPATEADLARWRNTATTSTCTVCQKAYCVVYSSSDSDGDCTKTQCTKKRHNVISKAYVWQQCETGAAQ